MDTNKKLLGILHIVYGTGIILLFFLINAFLQLFLPFIGESGDFERMHELIFPIVKMVFFILAVVIPIPSILGGIAILNGKRWGLIPMMISGCLSLLSFPLGTALGVFTIWVYLKDQKENSQ